MNLIISYTWILVRLWKDFWNTSKLGCGGKLSEGLQTLSLDLIQDKNPHIFVEATSLPILARGRIMQNSMSVWRSCWQSNHKDLAEIVESYTIEMVKKIGKSTSGGGFT